MYKSRQKIIVISSLSALSLIGFSLGAYFIATSFDTKEIKDKTDASYRGATSALKNQFDINQKNISLSDWIFSNMPTRINFFDSSVGNDKKYKIDFIDYTYNPLRESLGNVICSIDYTATSNNISYAISTDSNPPAPFKSLPLGGFSSAFGSNNEIIYNLTNYNNIPFKIELNKNTPPSPPTPNIDAYTSSLINDSFSLEEKIFTGTNPSATDLLFTYDIKDKSNTIIYKNQIQKTSSNSFQLIFTNPVASTTLNASVSKDTTITTPKVFSYNISYTGTLSGGGQVSISTYESYNQFWNYLSDKSIKMPNVFGTIGMLDWVSKIQ